MQPDVFDSRQQRIATVRIGPNVDLVHGLHQALAEAGFARAIVRSGLSSGLSSVGSTTGEVASGRVVTGENPVCVTAEVVLEEITLLRRSNAL